MPYHLTKPTQCIGVALRTALKDDDAASTAGAYIMAFGLFGFAGGATNWIAIVMLFDEIPGVFGSGIIPKQFKGEARAGWGAGRMRQRGALVREPMRLLAV